MNITQLIIFHENVNSAVIIYIYIYVYIYISRISDNWFCYDCCCYVVIVVIVGVGVVVIVVVVAMVLLVLLLLILLVLLLLLLLFVVVVAVVIVVVIVVVVIVVIAILGNPESNLTPNPSGYEYCLTTDMTPVFVVQHLRLRAFCRLYLGHSVWVKTCGRLHARESSKMERNHVQFMWNNLCLLKLCRYSIQYRNTGRMECSREDQV